MPDALTLAALQQMKRDGRKIVGVVVYDVQMAQVVDRAGVDLVSVGDSVGMAIWGQRDAFAVTLDQMRLVCGAVRRGVTRALVSCDMPYGPLQQGPGAAVAAAQRLVEEGASIVKLDAAPEYPDAVRAVVQAGIPVWAQFGVTPHGGAPGPYSTIGRDDVGRFVAEATLLASCGAAMLDFTHSGPLAGPAVVAAVTIPVLGGLGGGPWLDGRVRSIANATGYVARALDDETGEGRYANVARVVRDAVVAYADDVRAERQVRGG